MDLPKKVAVTGGIASGKTTICHLFEELGAYYISADDIVHQLLLPTTPIGQAVVDLLGPEIVVENKISRELIAKKVFDDPDLLSELEKKIHPEVQRVIEARYKAISKKNIPLFIAEVPLLFEAGLEHFYDRVIVVMSDEETCKRRFHNAEEYRRRSQRLMSIHEKIKRADFVIENRGSLEDLRQTIQPIFNALI